MEDAEDGLKPTPKRRLSDEAYSQIFAQLSRRNYAVGEKIPSEKDLASTLQISRPVLREALTRLQDDGLLEARRGAGTFVVRLPPPETSVLDTDGTAPEYIRTYEVRQAIEPEAARFAARRLTPESERTLAAALKDLKAAVMGTGNSQAEDFHFHLSIARATRNLLFVDQLMVFQNALKGSMVVTESVVRSRSLLQVVYAEHEAIFEAIKSRDEDLAAVMMAHHVAQVRLRMIGAYGSTIDDERASRD